MISVALRGLNILVVDDDPHVRALYAIVLREAGATVTLSGTALEAVQLVDLHPPDVVVTDLHMPRHDGVWLLQEAKRRMPGTPVIVVTGAVSTTGDDPLLDLGFAESLHKPLILSQLAEAVARAVRRPDST